MFVVTTPNDGVKFRPCQQAYLAPNLILWSFKPSLYGPKAPHEEAIFVQHAANTKAFTQNSNPRKPSTWYSVRCTSERDVDRKRRGLEQDKKALLHSINSARGLEGVPELMHDRALSEESQAHAETMENLVLVYHSHAGCERSVRIETTVTHSDSTGYRRTVRLISPPGLGALACGRQWCGGKLKRHHFRCILGTGVVEQAHVELCDGLERKVREVLIDAGWSKVGIGRSGDGRWIVEVVGEGDGEMIELGEKERGGAENGLEAEKNEEEWLRDKALPEKPLPDLPGVEDDGSVYSRA